MTRADFRTLFLRALNAAADSAEAKLAEPVPRLFRVELHGAGCAGSIISVDEAINRLYLADDRFFRIVDLAVTQVLSDETVVFARVSGHAPGPFANTYDPSDLGPFKQIAAEHVIDRRVPTG